MSWMRHRKWDPLSGRPDYVLPVLHKRVMYYGQQTSVFQFYVGRSIQPEIRQIAHGSDDHAILYESMSLSDTKSVERHLIRAFEGYRKYNNRGRSSGGHDEDGIPNFVYVGWWYPRLDKTPRRLTDSRPNEHPANDWVYRYRNDEANQL